jgi:hypothetical protein
MKVVLSVAINKYNGAPLRGCINDSNNITALLAINGYSVTKLQDADATKANIINELTKICSSLTVGDHFIFHYSGHGSQLPTAAPDEEDFLTEILCPYDLINVDGSWTDNYITDDELRNIFNTVNVGVIVECILDCCHSGTATRSLKPNIVSRYILPPANLSKEINNIKTFNIKLNDVAIICWSGCTDSQTSADAYIGDTFQGAFTAALLTNDLNTSRQVIYQQIQSYMTNNGYTQTPQIYCPAMLLQNTLI